MDDFRPVQKVNRVENLEYESSDEIQWQSIVTVTLDEFIQVHREQLKGHALNDNK